MTYCYNDYIKVIIKNIPISRPNNVVKEDWLVSQPAIFCLEFSSGSTVLFWIQENHYRAIHFWKNDSYTYYYDHIVNPTVLDLYLHLGWVIFHITTFFPFLPFLCASAPPFWFPHYLGLLPTCQTGFFFSRPVNAKWEDFPWLPNTTIDITINYFYCIIIVSQSSSLLVYSKIWERLVCFFLLWIFPILGKVSWRSFNWHASQVGWLVSVWYIQVLFGIFQMNS